MKHWILIGFILVITVACRLISTKRINNIPPSYYIRHDTGSDAQIANDVLIFSKSRHVRYSREFLEPRNELLLRMQKYCIPTKYKLNGDSIHFHLDSMFMGFSTVSYKFQGVDHIDSIPQYTKGYNLDFFGAIRNDSIFFRIIERDTIVMRDTIIRTGVFVKQ